MTLHEAIDFLLNEVYLSDFIYDVREREENLGLSWDGPFVKKYTEALEVLKDEIPKD